MPWKAKNNDDNIQNIIDTYKHFIEVEDLVKSCRYNKTISIL